MAPAIMPAPPPVSSPACIPRRPPAPIFTSAFRSTRSRRRRSAAPPASLRSNWAARMAGWWATAIPDIVAPTATAFRGARRPRRCRRRSILARLFERLFGDVERNSRGARQAPQLQQEHSGFRSRRHPAPRKATSAEPTAASSTSTSTPFARSSGVSRWPSTIPRSLRPNIEKPAGVPVEFTDHVRLMFDLMALAFQADLTRISTFMICREGSTRTYREIGVSDAHHPLTHHRNNPELIEKVTKINCFHLEQFAYFIGQAEIHAGWRWHPARPR